MELPCYPSHRRRQRRHHRDRSGGHRLGVQRHVAELHGDVLAGLVRRLRGRLQLPTGAAQGEERDEQDGQGGALRFLSTSNYLDTNVTTTFTRFTMLMRINLESSGWKGLLDGCRWQGPRYVREERGDVVGVSPGSRSISMTFSTPLAPRITGTPT